MIEISQQELLHINWIQIMNKIRVVKIRFVSNSNWNSRSASVFSKFSLKIYVYKKQKSDSFFTSPNWYQFRCSFVISRKSFTSPIVRLRLEQRTIRNLIEYRISNMLWMQMQRAWTDIQDEIVYIHWTNSECPNARSHGKKQQRLN